MEALYHPAQVALVLGRSEWWVREQARKARIPFCKVGNSYRFTAGHIAEIIALLEVRPQVTGPAQADPRPMRRPRSADIAEPQARLRARPPRRVRGGRQTAAAA
ncbi:DNA-binding protein [Kitasatospora sp. MAP12-9]|uniref:DNA-binding protein n=1 Tax=Kitasatospora sp. MAP12-9 TaxID=3035100 RepID=UPI003D1B03E1